MAIDPALAMQIGEMAFAVVRSLGLKFTDEKAASGAILQAALVTIDECEAAFGERSPEWNELVELIGNSESAAECLRSVQLEHTLRGSEAVRPFADRFARRFIGALLSQSKSADTAGIIASIGILGERVRALEKGDPLAGIDWYRHPSAPRFTITLSSDPQAKPPKLLLLATFRLQLGSPVPGGLKSSWRVDDGEWQEVPHHPQNGTPPGWATRRGDVIETQFDSAHYAQFRLLFVTDAGEHGYIWRRPLVKSERGGWQFAQTASDLEPAVYV